MATNGGELTVFDFLGRVLWQKRIAIGDHQATIEGLDSWPSGTYTVVLRTHKKVVAKQLMVE